MSEFVATHTPKIKGMDPFTRGYLEAVEFTDGAPAETLRGAVGFSNAFLHDAIHECAWFQSDNAKALLVYAEATGGDMASAGHDFWLTRNRHGSGFWDRSIVTSYPAKDVAQGVLDALTTLSHAYGEVTVYVCDDTHMIYGG